MSKILPITGFSANSTKPQKQNNKLQKEFYLNLSQSKLASIGIASASLGVIRACYALDELKKSASKYTLRGSLLQGAITTGFMAALFALTQIKYGIRNINQKS